MPAPVAVLVEVDGEPVFQAYIAYCAICRGPCRGAPPPKVAYARPGKKKTKVAQGGGGRRVIVCRNNDNLGCVTFAVTTGAFFRLVVFYL